ncbi:MAG: TonB-dependent receptor [Pseudomonadota bacterium]
MQSRLVRAMCAFACALVAQGFAVSAFAAEGRQIEEVVVTAERKEASVQDTSISITAFTGEMIEDFGIRNQSDLQNLIPATTIQPYDSAVRGVGRNFRNLGGDPGVSTYINGIYSEDLYTATIGSFWDVERIEVLRGPQGTLYGRNAVGGAMNFIYKKPTDEFDFSAKSVIGDYGTNDFSAMINVPLIDGVLNSRVVASTRRHDGWVEERGVGPDLDSGDEKNLAVLFEWLISDNMGLNVRANRARVDRVFGGADGGGLIVLSGENTVLPGNDTSRNYDVLSHRIRAVDPTVTDPLSSAFVDPSQPIYNYTNPTTGGTIQAQRVRPGVDSAGAFRNHGVGLGLDPNECVFSDREDIKGDDLCAFTNGLNNETFNQEGVQLEFSWDISDAVTFKYLFGSNELIYERITEDDSSASLANDRQFYVNHEAEYISHEFQLFYDLADNFTVTSGLFFYKATIDQRYDFFSTSGSNQFNDPTWGLDNILATVAPGAVPGDPALGFLAGAVPVNIESARQFAEANGLAGNGQFTTQTSFWSGDAALDTVNHGPATRGTDLHGVNKTERDALAVYTQAVWDINEDFTLTVGIRYAEDDVEGREQLAQYAETTAILDAVGLNLGTVNILRGAVDPATLQLTGAVDPWLQGVPIVFGAYREVARVDDEITWRVNLDYNLNDDSLLYVNATTGYRSGGFNLAFFSQTPQYDPEELIAYEVGYKGQMADGTVQLNASAYFYDYETIHTRTEEACPPGGTLQSAQSACAVVDSTTSIETAPGAEVMGFEAELLWLATDNLTIGGNYSYTDTEYTEDFFVVDGSDPRFPGDIYDAATNPDRRINIKGNRLLQVPESKASAWGSYRFNLDEMGSLELLLAYSYIDDVYFSAFESELDLAPAYDRWDVRGTWRSNDQHWVVTAFVNNVTDDIGIRQILRHGAADGFRRTAQVTEPRVYGLEVTYQMNPQ